MNALGISHIALLLAAYVFYLLTTLRAFSGKVSYAQLTAANVSYVLGFVLGMLWSNQAWGFYLSADPKIVLSALVPVPYILESVLRTGRWHLTALGAVLIIMNYILPYVASTVHVH
jgi:ABC-type transport system involved in cytochrome c biogenesis permease subunit